MAHQSNWDRLIRFKDADGQVRYGEPNASLDKATVWEGGNILELRKTDQSAEVKEVRVTGLRCRSNNVLTLHWLDSRTIRA